MCANCVAQGALYVGGALTALQAMAHRAKVKRSSADGDAPPADGDADAGAATSPSAGTA